MCGMHYSTQKYILLSLAIGVQQIQLQSPPDLCIGQLVLTQKIVMLLSMLIFKQKLIFWIICSLGFFPFTLAFHNIINRLPQMLAAQKLFIIFTWEINFSVGHFFCILCILSAVFLCYSY